VEGKALASRNKCEVKPAPVKQEFNSKVIFSLTQAAPRPLRMPFAYPGLHMD